MQPNRYLPRGLVTAASKPQVGLEFFSALFREITLLNFSNPAL